MACGEVLPDAPRPSASQAPFLQLEGTRGRSITGVDGKLTYRAGASAPPYGVELGRIRGAVLVRHPPLEGVLIVLVAVFLGVSVSSLLMVAAGLAAVGVLVALLWRRYSLGVVTLDGARSLWPLGWLWLGSRRVHALEQAWSAGAQALASRGVSVQDSSGASGPGA